jgi:Ca2+/Na+ antiporter
MHVMMMMVTVSLILASVAYWVMTASKKEQGGLKAIGSVIGWIILIYAVICLATSFFAPMTMKHQMGGCPMCGGMMNKEMMEQKSEGTMEKKDMMQQKGYKPMAAPKGEFNK